MQSGNDPQPLTAVRDPSALAHHLLDGGQQIFSLKRLERNPLSDELEQLGDAEDHVRTGGVLPQFAVDSGRDPEAPPVLDLVAADDDRSQRTERIQALAPDPLHVTQLQVPGADVIEDRVPGDERHGLLGRHSRRPPSDHDRQLTLVVQLRRQAMAEHRLLVPDEGVRVLGEQDWLRRDGGSALANVVEIIASDTDDGLTSNRAGFGLTSTTSKAATISSVVNTSRSWVSDHPSRAR